MDGKVYSTNSGGDCQIISYVNNDKVRVRFLDKYKHEVTTNLSNIRNGEVKNPYAPKIQGIGFIGVGIHKSRLDSAINPTYRVWTDMITRVYRAEDGKTNKSYSDVTVCEEWHNFQNFAEWYEGNYFYGLGYHLDKDILSEGSKVYSPKTCCLIPREINNLFVTKDRGASKYPQGVSYDKQRWKFKFQMGTGENRVSKRFDSIEEATYAYKESKEEYVRRVVRRWEGLIDESVFNKLIIWEFEI